MKMILVPIDGSDLSRLSIKKAKDIAKQFESELILLHVLDTFPVQPILGGLTGANTSVGGMPTVAPAAIIQLDQTKAGIDEIADKILESAKASCSVLGDKVLAVKLEGDPADRIIEYVEANKDIDLVVMGSHGKSAIEQLFVGSVTNKVIKSIDRSILIVR